MAEQLTPLFGGQVERQETPAGLVSVETLGEGPAVLLLHEAGLGAGRDEWAELAPLLAAGGYRVVAPDLPGFGDARLLPVPLYAQDAIAAASVVAEAQAVSHLVGRGRGAGYATALAAQDRGFATLTAINPVGIHPREVDDDAFTLWTTKAAHILLGYDLESDGRVRYERAVCDETAIRTWLTTEVYQDPTWATEAQVQAVLRRAERRYAEWLFASLVAGYLDYDLRADWVALTQPILLLWGEACDDPPLDDVDSYLMPLRPDAPFFRIGGRPLGVQKDDVTYRTIAATRRRPHVEAAAEVAEAILAHLAAGEVR